MKSASKHRYDLKWWLALVVVFGAFLAVQAQLDKTPTKRERVPLTQPLPGSNGAKKPAPKLANATMAPGRVVQLDTTRGRIDFVLFEKDCPETTKRIADLVSGGRYDKIAFSRVVNGRLIQTSVCKKDVPPMGLEVLKGLTNTKGAVGMARRPDPRSATSSFYILIEPLKHLDYDYTVFGRLIRGMDVVVSTKKGDCIKKATIRSLTSEDKKLFSKVLQIESERKTE